MSVDRILIVGGGPVGMVLALNLAALGARSVLINREPRPRWHPKGIDAELAHHGALPAARHRREHPRGRPAAGSATDVVYFTCLAGYELARIAMPSERDKLAARAAAPADDQVVEPIFRCNQMHVEAELFEQVQACPMIDSRYGWECVCWSEQADGVTAVIEEIATRAGARPLRGAYLAGCDGGHGIVRAQLGIGYQARRRRCRPISAGRWSRPICARPRCPPLRAAAAGNTGWSTTHIRSNIVAVDGKTEFLFNTRLGRGRSRRPTRR